MEEAAITIVGAGVIGLSVAYELSKSYKDIFVIERNLSIGEEISSRNSEVIHAGIYYPKDSLKAKTCIEGRDLLYEFCRKHNIGHKKIGKLIVAINDHEIKDLEFLFQNGINNGVCDLVIFSKDEIKKIEPNINAKGAIYSPSTGILDTHGFMKTLASEFKDRGGSIVFNTEVTGIEKYNGGFKVFVEDKREENFNFITKTMINCAGLNSHKVAEMVGIKKDEYALKYCKGDYFRVHNNKSHFINRLIYPVPKKKGIGLGIHATLDLSGSLRLGPDDEYVDRIDYNIDESKRKIFYESVKYFLPFIEINDLAPDMSGIRPKLQGPDEEFRDFLIKDESKSGIPGFINLIGIESPGFTACLAIAKLVEELKILLDK